MAKEAPYAIGAKVATTDGECGALLRVIVDPAARTLRHLVVGPRRGTPRLVPVGLVVHAGPESISLSCDGAQFDDLEAAEEVEFVPAEIDQMGYPADRVRWLPHYPLAPVGVAGTASFTYDRVPVGEVQIRRGEHVHAADGAIGRVRGLVVDPADDHVTHVLLEEGHLWGRKQVAIPIGAVTGVGAEGVALSLTKEQVRELPAVAIGELG